MFTSCIYAFFASLGFGIIFNIRGKKLYFAALGGSLGWFIYSLSLKTLPPMYALTLAALGFSIYSEIMARILKSPITIFVICALIPLVPGGGMYYTMLYILQDNLTMAIETGIETISNAGSLVMGILVVSSIMKILNNKKQNMNINIEKSTSE